MRAIAIATAVAITCGVWMSVPDAARPCHRTEFKTELVRNACARGGQAAAKEAMKRFVKEKKVKTCNHCHIRLAPTYELKPEALARFKELGGK